jgi:enoyl-CoA hydratase/carnithine racemase
VNKVVPCDELVDAARALAGKIALVPPVTAQVVKESINNASDLMGKSQSWRYHFMAHHFTHNTATALNALEERKQKSSMREVFADRDRGDVPPGAATE